MGFRFSRSVKIAPGVRLNVSKKGVGISGGPRGAKIGVGPRGVHHSVGIPGTGLSYREQKGWGTASESAGTDRSSSAPSAAASATDLITVRLALEEDGSVQFTDADGLPLPKNTIRKYRQERGDEIERWLEESCAILNRDLDRILNIHHDTPDINRPLTFEKSPFTEAQPPAFEPRSLGLLARIWGKRREKIESENRLGRQRTQRELDDWAARREAHNAQELHRQSLFEVGREEDPDHMAAFLEERFALIRWPRETVVSFEIADSGQSAMLDVDLPEIEDMPTERAEVACRGVKLNIKAKSDTHLRKDYAVHIHAILFRLVGEVFVALPKLQTVTISGYSQRPDPATGAIRDDYLLSTRIQRSRWQAIQFDNIPKIDLLQCFEAFELRRNMTKTGKSKPIEPFEQ